MQEALKAEVMQEAPQEGPQAEMMQEPTWHFLVHICFWASARMLHNVAAACSSQCQLQSSQMMMY